MFLCVCVFFAYVCVSASELVCIDCGFCVELRLCVFVCLYVCVCVCVCVCVFLSLGVSSCLLFRVFVCLSE